MATVPLTLHGCCFLISWLIHTFIFLLLSTHCNGTQISYSDHCASVVPESTATAPEFASLPFLPFQNGYYDGGDRILDPNPSEYSSNKHNLLSFHTQNVYTTNAEGVFKFEGNLHFYNSYHFGHGRTYGHSFFSPLRTGDDSALSFSLKGFWSKSSGKLCMVGSGTSYSPEESWGLIGGLEDRPLLQVETALLNASTCQDLLSPTSLVGSGLVDIAAGMDNKILSAMTRKRGRASGSSSNPPPPPKKTSVGPSKAPVPALPPPPPRKSGGERTSDKSPEVSLQSGDRSSPLPSREQGDYLSLYQKDYKRSVGPKMVKDIESMDLSELAASVQRVSFRLATMVSCYKAGAARHERKLQADNQELKKKADSADRSKEKLAELNQQMSELAEKVAVAESTSSKLEDELGGLKSDLQVAQSEKDTLRTALEGEIKSLSDQLAEEKGKSADVDDRLDAEYNSGVAFSYKCMMSALKEEYPELDMSKLESGVERYMAGASQGDKEQGEQDQVEAPLDRAQEEEIGGRAFEVGQGSVPVSPGNADLPPPEIADPLPPEVADLSAAGAADSHNL